MEGKREGLAPAEVEALEQAWLDAAMVLPGRRMQGVGCMTAFIGMVVLTLTPALANYVTISPETAYGFLALAIALLLLGAGLGLAGSRREPKVDAATIESAADRVARAHASGAPTLPSDAIALLALCRRARPGAIEGVRARLGEALPYVTAIERRFAERQPGQPPS